MSWWGDSLNDKLSNLKDQVTTFTKVLTDEDDQEHSELQSAGEGDANGAAKIDVYKKQMNDLDERLRASELHNAAKYNVLQEKYEKAQEEIKSFQSKHPSQEWGWETLIGEKGTQPNANIQSPEIVVLQNQLTDERRRYETQISLIHDKYQTQISQLLADQDAEKQNGAARVTANNAQAQDEVDQQSERTRKELENAEQENKIRELTEECRRISEDNTQLHAAMQQLDVQHQQAIDQVMTQKQELQQELTAALDELSNATGKTIETEEVTVPERADTPIASDNPLGLLMDKNQLLMTEIDGLKDNAPSKLTDSEVDELRVKEGIISQLQIQLEKANMDIENLKGDKKQAEDRLLEINHQERVIQSLQTELGRLKSLHDTLIVDKDSIIYIKDLELDEAKEQKQVLEDNLEQIKTQHQELSADEENNSLALSEYPPLKDQPQKQQEAALFEYDLQCLDVFMQKLDLKDSKDLPQSLDEVLSELASLRCERDKLHDSMQSTGQQLREAQMNSENLETEKLELERDCEDLRDQLEELQLGLRSEPEGAQSQNSVLATIQEEDTEGVAPVPTNDDNVKDWQQESAKLEVQMRNLLEVKMSIHNELLRVKQENLTLRNADEKPDSLDPNAVMTLNLTDNGTFGSPTERDGLRNLLESSNNREPIVSDSSSLLNPTEHESEINKYKTILICKEDQLDGLKEDIGQIGEIFGLTNEDHRKIYVTVKQGYEKLKKEHALTETELEETQTLKVQLLQDHQEASDISQSTIETLKSELEEVQRHNIDLQSKLVSSDSGSEELQKMLSKVSELQQELQAKTDAYEKVIEELATLRTDSTANTDLEMSLKEARGVAEHLKERNVELEELLNSLQEKLKCYTQDISRLSSERDTLMTTSTLKHQESVTYYEEIQKLSALIKEKEETFATEIRQQHSLLQAKEDLINGLERQLTTFKNEQSSSADQMQTLRNECQSSRKMVASLRKERDQLMLANSSMSSQYEDTCKTIASAEQNEKQLSQDCNRLREHLVSIEDAYTQEALEAEQKQTALKQTIAKLQDKLSTHSNLYSSNNQKFASEVDSLKEECRNAITQRDEAVENLKMSEEVSFQHQEALKRLQQVLHDFQKTQSRDIAQAIERECRKLQEEKNSNQETKQKMLEMQKTLSDVEQRITHCQNMEAEVQCKEDTIIALKSQVHATQQAARKSQDQVAKLESCSEAKVDKHLLRNLVIGYLATPSDKRHEVMRILAEVLDFSTEERHRTGVDLQPGSWMSSVANFLAPPPSNMRLASKVDVLDHSSLSQAFIRFLEDESTVRTSAILPALEMAEHMNKKVKQKTESKLALATALTLSSSGQESEKNSSHATPSANAFVDTANQTESIQNIPLLVAQTDSPSAPHVSEPKFLKNLLESSK